MSGSYVQAFSEEITANLQRVLPLRDGGVVVVEEGNRLRRYHDDGTE